MDDPVSYHSVISFSSTAGCLPIVLDCFNLLAPELFFLILAHSVYKMLIKEEPDMLELRNKLHFEEEETESIYYV